MNKDIIRLFLVVGAFVVGGTILLAFQLLPEDHADEFHPLSAGNMTFQSKVIMLREPTAGDDTTIYAINEVAAKAIEIAQSDARVKTILEQVRGSTVTIAGVQPTVLVDSTGKLIHSSSGQVVITANQERLGGKVNSAPVHFESIQGEEGGATQQIWNVLIDLDSNKVDQISKEPERNIRSTIQSNVINAEMNVFMPHAVKVTPGSTVRWFNDSSIPHNVVGTYTKNGTSDSVQIDSGFFGEDRSFQYTFGDEGVLEYRCTIHSEEGMKGTLIVSAT
ncbi:MAG TPA: plastocyanin/azurin family copper-binding protein [Nitrososphaera sp.]|nr:plastocyanin/azurin family copper-binding protein [Nitrososphaera sp.]